jgi:hypothetical protein
VTRQARRIARAMKAPLIFRSLPVIGAAATCFSCTVVSLHTSETTIPYFPFAAALTSPRLCPPLQISSASRSINIHKAFKIALARVFNLESSIEQVGRASPSLVSLPLPVLALSLSLHSGAPHYACCQSKSKEQQLLFIIICRWCES